MYNLTNARFSPPAHLDLLHHVLLEVAVATVNGVGDGTV